MQPKPLEIIQEFKPSVKTAVILRNPNNQRAAEIANSVYKNITRGDTRVAQAYIEDTQALPENYNPLLEAYDKDDRNAWLVVGGDGTFSQFANSQPESPVMIIPAGYANDMHKMLYLAKPLKFPGLILQRGKRSVIRPLEIKRYEPSNGIESVSSVLDQLYAHKDTNTEKLIQPVDTELAFGYWGLGLSGLVSHKLNQKDVRQNRDQLNSLKKFIYSGKIISKSILTSPEIEIIQPTGTRICHEILFANGSRMAKVIRFGGVDILNDSATMLELCKPSHSAFISLLGKSAVLAINARFNPNSQHTFGIKSSEDIYSQRDGEVRQQTSGAVFQVGISDYELNVITAR